MTTVIAKIAYSVDTSQLNKGKKDVEDLGKKTKTTKKGVVGLGTAFKAMGAVIAVVGSAVVAASKLAALGKAALDTADSIGKVSSKLGISAEQLQEFRIVAEAGGVSMGTFDMAFQRFTKRIGEAQLGTGELQKAFKELNIKIKDNNGNVKTNVQLFKEFGTKLNEVKDATLQVTLAAKAYDSEGVAMINFHKQTQLQMEELIATARRYGAVLSNELVASAEEYRTELGLIEAGTAALETQRGLALAPLTIEWELMKNEIAFATLNVMSFFGVIDDNATMSKKRVRDLKEEILELQTRIDKSSAAGFLTGSDEATLAIKKAQLEKEQAVEKEFADEAEKTAKERAARAKEISDAVHADSLKRAKDRELKAADDLAEAKKKRDDEAAVRKAERELEAAKKSVKAIAKAKADAEEAAHAAALVGVADFNNQVQALYNANIVDDEERLIQQQIFETDMMATSLQFLFDDIDTRTEALTLFDEWKVQKSIETMARIQELNDRKQSDAEDDLIKSAELEEAKRVNALTSVGAMIDSWIDLEGVHTNATDRMAAKQAEWLEAGVDGFAEMLVTGKGSFKELAASIIKDIAKMIIKQMIFNALASGGFGFSSGGVVSGGATNSRGNIVTGKKTFAGGAASMSEHGAEAIMPLGRDSQGRLGVRATGAGQSGGGMTIGSIIVNVEPGDDPQATGRNVEEGIIRAMKGIALQEIAAQVKSGGILNPTRAQAF